VDLKDRLRLEAFVKLLACEEIDDDGDDDEVIVHEGECSIKKLGHKWQRPQKDFVHNKNRETTAIGF
jgi:hypothetical protein